MSETVTVVLDRRRPYRARPEDRKAIWVGPGRVQVPQWVAEAWGMQATVAVSTEKESAPPVDAETSVGSDTPARPSPAPWDGYDAASAAEIIQRIPDLSETERVLVAAYEQRHKQRKTVLDAVQAEGEST